VVTQAGHREGEEEADGGVSMIHRKGEDGTVKPLDEFLERVGDEFLESGEASHAGAVGAEMLEV
jgi:hypothetical protein